MDVNNVKIKVHAINTNTLLARDDIVGELQWLCCVMLY